MNCTKFKPIKMKCSESGYFGRKLRRYSFVFLLIGLFIGVWLGQAWRIRQVEPTRDKEIAELKKKVDHYKTWGSPDKEIEVKASGRKKNGH